MTATTPTTTTQVFQIYIKATPRAVWDAITDPAWNGRYGYRAASEYDLRPGGAYRVLATPEMRQMGAPEVILDGEVLESDPPRRLVQTWKAYFSPEMATEQVTRLTWELAEQGTSTKLTLTHELEGAPGTAMMVSGMQEEAGGGWPFVLSDLKTLLETGKPIGDA